MPGRRLLARVAPKPKVACFCAAQWPVFTPALTQRAVLSIRYATMTVCPPIGKQKKYRHQQLQIIHAEEISPPEGRAPIFWKLITNLPVETHADAVHKLQWYALRWNIETFFRTLKTGCRIEDVRLASADRLANCIALCCVVAWRVSWLTILRRRSPAASPAAVFTDFGDAVSQRGRGRRWNGVPQVRSVATDDPQRSSRR